MSTCCSKPIAPLILFVIFFLSTLTLFPKTVFADRSINSVTLNGSSSVAVAPSASITASVSVTTNTLNDKNWRSTSWNISGSNCINHADHNGAGTYSENFTITAPSSPGTYNVSFIAYADSGCSVDASPTYTLTGGVVVSGPTPTPTSTPASTSTPTPTSTSSSSQNTSTSGTSSPFYPSITAQVVGQNPTNNANVVVSGNVSITQGTIKSVNYSIDNSNSSKVENINNGNFVFTTPKLSEGTHTIKIDADSLSGNSSSNLISVTVITTPPVVTLNKIAPNPNKDQTPTLTGVVTAKQVDIVNVEISVDGGKSWQSAKRKANTFSLTLGSLEDGNYQVFARAQDSAGNIGQSETQVLIIDTIPPIIGGGMQFLGPQILTPDKNGATAIVSGTEITLAVGMKGGVTEAEIKTDSNSFNLLQKEGTNIWFGKIKFDQAGEKHLSISALDGAGNHTERKFNSLLVENSGSVGNKENKQVIENAQVSLYFFETLTKQWIIWDALPYGQHNPQNTDASGSYSFMVPPGKYYLEVNALGYNTLQTEIVTLSKTSILNYELPLTSKPKVEFSVPFFGKIILTIPSFLPPETISIQEKPSVDLESETGTDALEPGISAQDFSFFNLENKQVKLDDFKGKNVLLSFIAPWSASSLEQAQFLSQASMALEENQTILVVALQESVATTQTLMKKGNYKFLVVADKDGNSAAAYKVTILPQHVFIDRKGDIQETFTGVLTAEEMTAKLTNIK